MNVNAQGGDYGDALHAARSAEYEGVGRRLFEKGANIKKEGRGLQKSFI